MRMLLALFVPACGFAFAQTAVAPQPFTITVTAATASVAAGSPVSLTVILKNMSKEPLDDSGSWDDRTHLDPNFKFIVQDAQGRPVPKRIFKHPEFRTGSPLNRTLAPGESVTEEQEVSRLYDFSEPGKYTIQVAMRIPKELGSGMVASNSVTVTVTK
jgi:hypothetical protein